jgi:hypothetical protein
VPSPYSLGGARFPPAGGLRSRSLNFENSSLPRVCAITIELLSGKIEMLLARLPVKPPNIPQQLFVRPIILALLGHADVGSSLQQLCTLVDLGTDLKHVHASLGTPAKSARKIRKTSSTFCIRLAFGGNEQKMRLFSWQSFRQ